MRGDRGSISPTFYAQLLRLQITKAQKRQSTQAAFELLGFARVKGACKHVDEIDPEWRNLKKNLGFKMFELNLSLHSFEK